MFQYLLFDKEEGKHKQCSQLLRAQYCGSQALRQGDGREKYYWEPGCSNRLKILYAEFKNVRTPPCSGQNIGFGPGKPTCTHRLAMHRQQFTLHCRYCGMLFDMAGSLKTHEKSHCTYHVQYKKGWEDFITYWGTKIAENVFPAISMCPVTATFVVTIVI